MKSFETLQFAVNPKTHLKYLSGNVAKSFGFTALLEKALRCSALQCREVHNGELTSFTEEKINQEENVEKLEEIAGKMINLSLKEDLLELLEVS